MSSPTLAHRWVAAARRGGFRAAPRCGCASWCRASAPTSRCARAPPEMRRAGRGW